MTAVLLAVFSQPAFAAEDFDKYYPGDWRTEEQGAITRLLQQKNAYGSYQYKMHKHDRHFFLVKSGNRLFKVSTRRNTIEEVE